MSLTAVYNGSNEADTTYSGGADLDAGFSVDDLDITLFPSQSGR